MAEQTPIYTATKKYVEKKYLRLHMPGHGGLQIGLAPEFDAMVKLDLTEVPGMDDLHQPQDIIAQAQKMLARACGARESFYLVNGSTSGIQSLFMGMGDGEKVMIPRNAHRSFYEGMVLSGTVPVYIPCQLDSDWGIPLSVNHSDIETLLQVHNDTAAVFLTNPSYYGICGDIAGIAAITGKWDKDLLVDEAHGAHFHFHHDYPISAVRSGAQAAVNSLHKSWPVMTQGACLHLGEGLSRRDRVLAAYSLLTTTSPSYLFLASMDSARNFMEQRGQYFLDRALHLSREFKALINQIQGISCIGEELADVEGICGIDPLKVVINVSGLGLSGHQAERLLRCDYKIQIEMAETNLVLAMFSLLHDREDWEKLYFALNDIANRYPGNPKNISKTLLPPDPQMMLSPRHAFLDRKKRISWKESRGKIAGELITAYPPGIPAMLPGEIISGEIWDYVNHLTQIGGHIQGPEDPELKYIKIIDC